MRYEDQQWYQEYLFKKREQLYTDLARITAQITRINDKLKAIK